jgi:hypothetical protein
MLPLKLPGIITTYISGTWTALVSGLVLIGAGRKGGHGNQAGFEDRLFLQAAFLAVYFLSAVAAGWIFHYAPAFAGDISAMSILMVAAYGAMRD